jgi:hypothetical protein
MGIILTNKNIFDIIISIKKKVKIKRRKGVKI